MFWAGVAHGLRILAVEILVEILNIHAVIFVFSVTHRLVRDKKKKSCRKKITITVVTDKL